MKLAKYLLAIYLLYSLNSFSTSTAHAQDINLDWQQTTLTQPNLTSLLVTSKGLYVGQNTNFTSERHYNGIYFSIDNGTTWQERGLASRRVNDILEYQGALYAATEYSSDGITNGLFTSNDGGATWQHVDFINSGITKLAAISNTLFVGTKNNGLWMKKATIDTWQQPIGSGYYGAQITALATSGRLQLAATDSELYASTDFGDTWYKVPYFNGKKIASIYIDEERIFIGAKNTEGLFVSTDNLVTFSKISYFNNKVIGAITKIDDTLFVTSTNTLGQRTIFSSSTGGQTWQDTHLLDTQSFTNVPAIKKAYLKDTYMFAATHNSGLYKTIVSAPTPHGNQFLDYPITIPQNENVLDFINAYFDHAYPLLGYTFFKEPDSEKTSTFNFLGIKDIVPNLYYSSHDAIDFDASYGTPVYAPANGYAKYMYCNDCGHTIKIDHKNGYQTTYMHLQREGLITQDTKNEVHVSKGDSIGFVGLSGNTTGPHLHFVVTKDTNGNGIYTDDYPHGKVDPFGWLPTTSSTIKKDPWELFSWQDTLGTHIGSNSEFLWNDTARFENTKESVNSHKKEVIHENKTIVIEQDTFTDPVTISIMSYLKPMDFPINLKYIKNTASIINAFSYLGDVISSFQKPIKLTFDLRNNVYELVNVLSTTLKIYYFSESVGEWLPLEDSYFDTVENKVHGYTSHFSRFAVFGMLNDPPAAQNTVLTVSGDKNVAGWYTGTIRIVLAAQTTPHTKTFYKLSYLDDWQEYTKELEVKPEKSFFIQYRSHNTNTNYWENTKSEYIKVLPKNAFSKSIRINEATFSN